MTIERNSFTKETIGKNEYFIYIKASEALKGIIAHYTIANEHDEKRSQGSDKLHLIPDVSGSFVISLNSDFKVLVWGPSTKVRTIDNDMEDPSPRIFVEFLPGGMFRILGVHMRDLLNGKLSLQQINERIYNDLEQCLQGVTTYDEVVDRLNAFFIRLAKEHTIVPSLQKWIEKMYKEKMRASVKEIANQMKISERQLNRYANKYLGMGFKCYYKICNVNHLIKEMHKKKLIDLTFEYDYFDQAHFNHVFRDVCETTPKDFKMNMSSYYNEMYKF